MIRCSRCLMPTARPDTEFTDGVCSACISYDKRREINWEAREKALLQILDEHHGECLVASSGGKDSHWIALKLLELGAHVTCVTATTCYLTEIGSRNIDNLARYARTIEYTPNRTVRAKLNRLGLQMVGDISWPEHVAIFTIPFRVAEAFGFSLIWYGENPQNQYGGPSGTDAALELTPRWRSEFGGFLGLRPSDLIGIDGITDRDMQDYTLPSVGKAKAYFLGQYFFWDSHRNATVAQEHGMACQLPSPANWWIHENLDCIFTSVHDHLMYRKYGFGRATAQLSVDIRSGLIDRGTALGIIRKRDGLLDNYYAGENIWVALQNIGVSKDRFVEIADRFTNWDLFSTIDNLRPILKEFAVA